MFAENTLNEIYNKYREGRLAHAYLIETNNIPELMKDVKTLIKALNCPNKYYADCSSCNLCNLVEKNNLPSLIIIEPEGTSIKKSQIENLKIAFETKPIYSKYNIYVILNAEKLNSSSANAMLKFVEEPNEGILGFFITNNKDVIIPTIKSRCQSLIVTYKTDTLLEKLNITEEMLEENLRKITEYFQKIFDNKIINNKEEILSKYPERKDLEILFKIIFEIYHNLFLKEINKAYNQRLVEIIKQKETKEEIINKLNIITKFLQDLSYNVNMELLLDSFVVEMRSNHG